VFPITIPALRDRPADIPLLAKYFVERFCGELNKKVLNLAPSALDELSAYTWPGNVRELQNCIERAVILTDGDTIHARHLNLPSRQTTSVPVGTLDPWEQIDLSGSLADASQRVLVEVERRKIEAALKHAGGNQAGAAETLQISPRALVAKLREYGLVTA
jgi:DNA-binding NtrC family response regulator